MSGSRFIEAEQAELPVAFLGQHLGVSRRGYDAWRGRRPSARGVADEALGDPIRTVHAASRGTDGAPRVHAELADADGISRGRKRVAGLLGLAGLVGVCRRRTLRTTRREETAAPSDDLVQRAFVARAPDRLWFADITCLPTWQGFLYRAVILDACSRRLVGGAMADHQRADLMVDALELALWNRRPSAGLVHHSASTAARTPAWPAGRAVARPGSAGRWARSVTAPTTPGRRASAPRWSAS